MNEASEGLPPVKRGGAADAEPAVVGAEDRVSSSYRSPDFNTHHHHLPLRLVKKRWELN